MSFSYRSVPAGHAVIGPINLRVTHYRECIRSRPISAEMFREKKPYQEFYYIYSFKIGEIKMVFIEIKGYIQKYLWGMKGTNSQVAKYIDQAEKIEEDVPYAELWLSTHKNGSAISKEQGKLLYDIIGKDVGHIFKILSIGMALSIQAHPRESVAQELHKKDPKNYPDPNDKPEMVISMGPMKTICGFMPLDTIKDIIRSTKPWYNIIDPGLRERILNAKYTDEESRQLPKDIFSELLHYIFNLKGDKLETLLRELYEEAKSETQPWMKAFVITYTDFPGDVGSLFTLLLNYIELKDGESMFLAPDEPHAYLRGNCIEVMNFSDNVVRAGLTGKYKDVLTLCEILTFKAHTKEDLLVNPDLTGNYLPNTTKFALNVTKVRKDTQEILPRIINSDNPEGFLFVAKGHGLITTDNHTYEVSPGFSAYYSQNADITVIGKSEMTVYRTYRPGNNEHLLI